MAELTHDAEDGFHEIQLSGKQLVFLFMATTLVSVVIFLCGVLVGRGVRAERAGDETPIAEAATPAAPSTAAAAPPETAPPVPTELTYDKALRDPKASSQPLQKAPEPASPPAATNPPAAVPPAPPAAQTQTPEKPSAASQPPRADVPTSGRAGAWVIQVHALQNRDAATTFVRTLASKGYPAFLLNPAAGSPQIYRVQIGGYRDRAEAEQVARRLEKEEQFRPAIKRR